MKRRDNKWHWLAITIACVCIHNAAFAGSKLIGDTAINGLNSRKTHIVEQGKRVELCYRSNRYAFSSLHKDNIYTVFFLTPQLDIEGSVGKNGANHASDVRKIKKVLKELKYYHGPLDSTFNNDLQKAIERVQRELLMEVQPDALISTAAQTIRALRIAQADSLFVRLDEKKRKRSSASFKISDCVYFFAPNRVDNFDIYYNELSYIIDYALGKEAGNKVTVLNANEERLLKNHLYQYSSENHRIARIWVKPSEQVDKPPFSAYLQVNGKDLVLETGIAPGFSQEPLVLSWHIRPEYKNSVQYQYRMLPEHEEWTPWATTTAAQYYFLNKGPHLFELRTRYRDARDVWHPVPNATYDFDLDRAFVSKPIIKTVAGPSFKTDLSAIDIDNIYRSSHALLIGVDKFQDKHFSPLSYVAKDIRMMAATLSNLGFRVETLTEGQSKHTIVETIKSFTGKIKSGDRVVVYISSHGFSNPILSSQGFIAANDCAMDDRYAGCIELGELQDLMKKIQQKSVQHLLVILDSCSSGLGVIDKDLQYQEISIATKSGSHMLTAGMADQKAQMDHQLAMSTFTYYLTKGLQGEADIIEDGVISLSELLLYVRFQVAKKTDGLQTPMIGRLSGEGEMIFKP
ncbi:putative peptidoglycan binding protein [Alteromonadaceae bacterium 2753L.S.0a.02]|nr:putative peptidoglycan binding protein [Alteromonadaceae bacterium 2753L.S.0a.02]